MTQEALKLALEALEKAKRQCHHHKIAPHLIYDEAIAAIHKALAQPAQEVAAFIAAEERKREERYGYFPKLHPSEYMDEPVQPTATYTCGVCGVSMQMEQPTKRPWVGLTDVETSEIAAQGHQRWKEHAEAIEAKLKEKNT